METNDLSKIFELSDTFYVGESCVSSEDCEVAEEINQAMKQAWRAYSSNVEKSYKLCAGLNFA